MKKKVLAVYYSQSGQLKSIIDNFCEPIINAGCEVEKVAIKPVMDFTFPWTTKRFFSVMPHCVSGKIYALQSFTFSQTSYDLVVLGWQPWFLSPSIPVNALLHDQHFSTIVKNTPLITITGVRNMWVNAFSTIKNLLQKAGANHAGTIVLKDRHLNLISIFTIFHWMLKGKKDRYLKFFPLPGVSDKDISNTKKFGSITLPFLQKNKWNGLQNELIKNKAAEPAYHLMFIENKAGKMFKLWAKIINKKQNKTLWLAAFKYYLLIALFIAAPLVYIINLLVYKPFLPAYVRRQKAAVLKLD